MSKIFQHFYDQSVAPGQSFARASQAAYVTAQGKLALADVDVPRFEADGLLLEPAALQYLPDPASMTGLSWSTVSATSVPAGSALWGLFSGLRVASQGAASAQHKCTLPQSFAAGEAMAFSALYRAGDVSPSGSITLIFRNVSTGDTATVAGAGLSVEGSSAGTFSKLRSTAMADGAALVQGVITWTEAGTALDVGAGPNSSTVGESILLYGLNLTNLAVPSSFIFGASRAADALGSIALVGQGTDAQAALPQAFAWDETAYPLGLTGLEQTPQITLAPRNVVDPAIFTGPAFYADSSKADNAGDGLSAATAMRDISACILAGNAAGQPYRVLIEAGDYFRRESMNGDSGTIEPTQPCGFIAQNGRARLIASTDVPYSVHSGSTYVGPHSTAGLVLDRLNADANGAYAKLTKVGDVAACTALPGSWVTIGGQTYIHRSDGLAPTSVNTLLTRNINVARFTAWDADAYLEGIDFEGGLNGAVNFTAQANRAIAADDCSFSYAGYPGQRNNGTEIYNASGLVYFRNCRAAGNYKDGFGFHGDAAAAQLYVLTSGCAAHRNGEAGGVSINAYTVHENILALDIAGHYSGGFYDGSVCHNIDTSKCVFVGTRIEMLDSPDDIDAAVRTGSGARSWLAGCTVISDNNAFFEDGNGQIEFQNCAVTGAITGADAAWQPQTPWSGIGIETAALAIGVRFPHGPPPNSTQTLACLNGDGANNALDIRSVSGGDVTDIVVRAGGVITSDTGPGVALSSERLMAAARMVANDFAVSFSGNVPDKNARNGGAAPRVQTLDLPAIPAAMYLDYSAVYDAAFTDAQLQAESDRALFARDRALLPLPDAAIGISHDFTALQVGIYSVSIPDPALTFTGTGFLAKPAEVRRRYAPGARRSAFTPHP